MPRFICVTCGTQYPDSEQPPAHCLICEDERQYVNPNGQQWTTLDALRADRTMVFEQVELNLQRLKPEPKIGIGQHAHLIQTPEGCVLWDCVPFIDDVTITRINALGGLRAIAISHPHFHTLMGDWSATFDNAPIYIHAGNRFDVVDPNPAIVFWEGASQPILDGITQVHCGGHFAGSTVLHWRDGAQGRGVLLTSDTIDIVADPRWASFMYSYPNLLPLPPKKVQRIVESVEPYAYDRLYESFGGVMDGDAKAKVRASAERYIRCLQDD